MRKYFAKTLTGVLMFLCLFCSQLSFAQSKVNLSGIVRDSNADPLVGVNILEQGTTNGTMTDIIPSDELIASYLEKLPKVEE